MADNDYSLQRMACERVVDRLRAAENARLLRGAPLGLRRLHSPLVCRILGGLGHGLVALGRWLEGYGLRGADGLEADRSGR